VYKPGDRLVELYRRALREPGFTLDVEVKKGQPARRSRSSPGTSGASTPRSGPVAQATRTYDPRRSTARTRPTVMVIGKMPWKDETAEGRNLVGAVRRDPGRT
jgi:hypothetical protein